MKLISKIENKANEAFDEILDIQDKSNKRTKNHLEDHPEY